MEPEFAAGLGAAIVGAIYGAFRSWNYVQGRRNGVKNNGSLTPKSISHLESEITRLKESVDEIKEQQSKDAAILSTFQSKVIDEFTKLNRAIGRLEGRSRPDSGE